MICKIHRRISISVSSKAISFIKHAGFLNYYLLELINIFGVKNEGFKKGSYISICSRCLLTDIYLTYSIFPVSECSTVGVSLSYRSLLPFGA